MGDDRGSVYEEDNRIIYRASSIWSSSHALIASRMGIAPMPVRPELQARFDDGKLHEPAIIESLERDGWEVTHTGEGQLEYEIPVTSRIAIRCHPDGIAGKQSDPARNYVLEVKALANDSAEDFNRNGLLSFPSYQAQVSLEMAGSGLPCMFVVKNKNSGKVYDPKFILTSPISLHSIKTRVLQIEKAAREGKLEGLGDKCGDWFCRYWHLHTGNGEPAPTVDDAILDSLAETYDRAREREQVAKAAKDAARARILDHVGEGEKVRTGRWSVSHAIVTRKGYDMKKLAETVDLAPYKTATSSPRLTVTELGDD